MDAQASELIGEHPAMREVRRLIRRVALSRTRIAMVYGETGTGKGLAARLMHDVSERSRARFIDVNCAAIPSSLLESELFGHEKGAFTGAVARKSGLVEEADGGTLFLDEIGELDLPLQAKLLSVLDSQEFRRVGSVKPVRVDVRFVAASNKRLTPEIRKGTFREDLFYRLQLVFVTLPPLRDRGGDVMLLARHFLDDFGRRYGREVGAIDPEVEAVFRRYPWPGNVRELRNLLERIFILYDDEEIRVEHLPPRMLAGEPPPAPAGAGADAAATDAFKEATVEFQRRHLRRVLDDCDGALAVAARRLGLSRHALRYQLQRLGLR